MSGVSKPDRQKIELIFQQHPGVIAAWIFGSAQQGQPGPGRDLDIGVLFAAKPTLVELANLRADLQQGLQFDDIDLVSLNEASPILRFEAISGQLVYCDDRGRRAEFASLTAREYEDAMALLQRGLAI